MHIRNIILLTLFPIFAYSQLQIEGSVLDKTKGTSLPNSRITLYLFQRDSLIIVDSSEYNPFRSTYFDSIYKKIDRVFTDTNGYFLFTNLYPGVYKVIAENLLKKTERGIYYEEQEAVIYSILNCDSSFKRNIYLSVFCPFDSTKNLAVCPICSKQDMLREFRYGLPSFPLNDENKYIYTFDCSPPRCRPSKYCVRCKHEF